MLTGRVLSLSVSLLKEVSICLQLDLTNKLQRSLDISGNLSWAESLAERALLSEGLDNGLQGDLLAR